MTTPKRKTPAKPVRHTRPSIYELIVGLIFIVTSIPQRILSDNLATSTVAAIASIIGCITVARWAHYTITWITERWVIIPTDDLLAEEETDARRR